MSSEALTKAEADAAALNENLDAVTTEAVRLHNSGYNWPEVAMAVNKKFGSAYTAATIAMKVSRKDHVLRPGRKRKTRSDNSDSVTASTPSPFSAKAPKKDNKAITITLTIDGKDGCADYRAKIRGFDKNGLTLILDIGELKIGWHSLQGIIVSGGAE